MLSIFLNIYFTSCDFNKGRIGISQFLKVEIGNRWLPLALMSLICSSSSVCFWNTRKLARSLRSSVGNNAILYPSAYRCCCLSFIMAVVIRLQGLRVTAGSEDIRKFFTGLKIPDGGVHIIGGEKEEAFIIFASDEDARRAMTRSGGCIKGLPVTLLLSSKTEMQTILERSTKKVELDLKMRFEENARYGRRSVDPEVGRRAGHSPPRQHQRPANPEDFMHGSVRRMPEMGRRFGGRSDHTPPPQHQRAANTDDLYLFLRGMPFSVTELEIRDFFSGLCVDRIFFLQHINGKNNGKAYVKFASSEDAKEGLKRDKNYIGSRYVEVFKGTEDDLRRAVGDISMSGNMNNPGRERSPLRTQRNPPHQERERSPIRNQRSPQHHARSMSPFGQRSAAPSNDEFCVLLENLPYTVDKEDIKKLYRNAKLEDDQILHLTGRDGRRTRSTFVLFQSMRDYFEALAHEKREFHNRCIFTRPISREKMITLLESQSMSDRPAGFSEGFQDRHPSNSSDSFDSEKTCLFVQNLPLDVRKVEIMDFFTRFNIAENKVIVLRDHEGGGVGKALVRFQSEAEARSACSLNGRRFLGSVVVLKVITLSEMDQLATDSSAVHEPFVEELQQREEQFSGRSSEASYHIGYSDYPDGGVPRDGNVQRTNVRGGGGGNSEPCDAGSFAPQDRGNGFRGSGGRSVQNFDRPICVQLINLPFQIKSEEIYDFCYGYRIIPGSVSVQCDQRGKPQGTATALFESRQEALTAIEELSGRPIGPRKIQLLLL